MGIFGVVNRLFPVWALLFGGLALIRPQGFSGLAGQIQPLLAVIMLAMGLTLSKDDFLRVARAPKPVAIGLALQFLVMPVGAVLISYALGLDAALTTGMVLVGASAGGTASNVITWLAGGRVALSVSMTLVSTLAAVVLTPLITWLLLGRSVEVPILDMLLSITTLVVAPVALGVVVHHFVGPRIRALEPVLATLAMAAIMTIIAIVVALNAGNLATLGAITAIAVVAHNALGLGCGYGISRLLGLDVRTARTVAIEVGMQNSGLAVALANQFFTATAALPGALFSVWHNVSGSLLAGYWKRRPAADDTDPDDESETAPPPDDPAIRTPHLVPREEP